MSGAPENGQLPAARLRHTDVIDDSAAGVFLSGLADSIAAQLVAQLGIAAVGNPSDRLRTSERAVFCVAEAAQVLGISRALAYDLVRRGELPSIRLGRRILVPRIALERLLTAAAAWTSVPSIETPMQKSPGRLLATPNRRGQP